VTSADRRRTERQAKALALGYHPLTVALGQSIRLHPNAAPPADRDAPGLRCGGCRHRQPGTYPKCSIDNSTKKDRRTHGAGTDVRAWFPACVDYEPAKEV
jgi:hypothetical protein